MLDDWEGFYGLNPASGADGMTDLDSDGVFNKNEFARGSDPTTPDHNSQMVIPGNLPLFSGDPSDSWSDANPRRRMLWNLNAGRWEALVFSPGATNFKFKFAAGNWGNGTWGWNSNGIAGQSSKWPNGPDSGNINHNFSSVGYYVVRFEEHHGTYSIDPLNTLDADRNNLPDEWVVLTGAANDPNSDQDIVS